MHMHRMSTSHSRIILAESSPLLSFTNNSPRCRCDYFCATTRNMRFTGVFEHFSLRSFPRAAIVARGIREAGAHKHELLRRKRNSMANPLSKSKIIAVLTEKVSTKDKPVSKKQIASFFDELFNLAVKETKSAG